MKSKKPSRAVFLLAAEYQFDNYANGDNSFSSKFSCDNLNEAVVEITDGFWADSAEIEMYKNLFEQTYDEYDLAWWLPLPNGNWDHESRILALLLCAEMLRR